MLQVGAGAEHLAELRPRQVCGKAVSAGREIAGDRRIGIVGRPEGCPARQIPRGIDLLRLTKKWIAAIGVRRIGMAVVAPSLRIDDVTAQTNQRQVLALEVQRYWCNLEPPGDARG